MNEIGRLRWRCRRGMLELDLVLLGFLETSYLKLDEEGRMLFAELLQEEDADLWQWMREPQSCPNVRWHSILKRLYLHAMALQ
jgi:antitoxin CptB